MTRPTTEHLTATYYEEWFVMSYKKLLTASHWVNDQGERTKLTHNIKAIYSYRLDQYRSFSREGKNYCESIKTVADKLAVSFDVAKETQALLIKMGLLVVEQPGTRTAFYNVFELKYMKGYLVNEKLCELPENKKSKKKPRKKVKDDSVTWQQIQAIEHNKKQIDKIKGKKEKFFMLTLEEMERLRGMDKGTKGGVV